MRRGRGVLWVSAAVAAGLTVDVGLKVYDRAFPAPNGLSALYRGLPSRALSRAWGRMAQCSVPEWLRGPLYGAYGWYFGVNVEEARDPLQSFPSMQAFFTRRLKPEVRPIVQTGIASPVDARVLCCGPVAADGRLPTVKDFTYSMDEFIGGSYFAAGSKQPLYQIVLYLAPGDYHGFHAPVDMTLTKRLHYAGYLLPVAPWMVKRVPSLFTVNERVVLLGTYKDGAGNSRKMAYAPVGATNVGSIALASFDPVTTNVASDSIGTVHEQTYAGGVWLKRGDEVGFFRMGSTVVMIFEAGANFTFAARPGDKVKLGQQLGN